jgi:serpin B
MRAIALLLLCFSLTGLSSCQQDEIISGNKNIELDDKSAQLIESDNAFGLEAFQRIRQHSDEENLMVSPLSISLALAMAYNGADGETKTEMEEVLRLKGLTPEEINNSYKILIHALQSVDKDVVFEIANAIYAHQGFPVKQSFLDVNQLYYDAEVNTLDFASPNTVTTINNWVADKTHDKIKKIIDSLSPDSRLVLLNAIYFYGTWTKAFDEDGTKMQNFRLADGSYKEIAMMSKEDNVEFTKNDLFSAVKLPYGSAQYNMLVLRPENENSSQDVINALSVDNWKSWNREFEITDDVVITMPRFKYAFEITLNDVLKQMGIIDAFSSSNADFSKISDQFLYISKAIHKSYIDVNETGTEAAAVTALVFETTSMPVDPKTYFTVDRPFIFAITEKDTGAILFIGQVQNPEYEE